MSTGDTPRPPDGDWLGTPFLKFTREGKFVMQIGKSGPQTDSKDTTRLGRPANMTVDSAANEVYVADGYYNHRIIVFDSETGVFKRMWGAYSAAIEKHVGSKLSDTDALKLCGLLDRLGCSCGDVAAAAAVKEGVPAR